MYIKLFLCVFVNRPEDSSTQETDFEPPELLILPPPDLYADLTVEWPTKKVRTNHLDSSVSINVFMPCWHVVFVLVTAERAAGGAGFVCGFILWTVTPTSSSWLQPHFPCDLIYGSEWWFYKNEQHTSSTAGNLSSAWDQWGTLWLLVVEWLCILDQSVLLIPRKHSWWLACT